MPTRHKLIATALVLLAVATPAQARVAVNRGALAAVEWMTAVEDRLDRARTFYRSLEGLLVKMDEVNRGVGYDWGLVKLYREDGSITDIARAIPSLCGETFMRAVAPDWPALAPVEWYWLEPTENGIMAVRAGESGYVETRDRGAYILWMVDVELPTPDRRVVSSLFFDAAVLKLQRMSPSLRVENGRVYTTVYPSVAGVRALVQETYRLRANTGK